ncbi:HPr(Ser) kinase/phosphatase [Peribacillus frigoritolerans]|jgi:HPr kinase/phosphorylase|uniref:HPr kinase/phosphorylase n=3 Tax=Peribacillus TaxID=2675229 RepID=A0A3T0MBI4_9BACI|nr:MULTISPECIES: HPr(Ser) kinase/phosphatase [Peribacillus]KOR81017.1 serine kinase [Bacillus sp. FJAT-21352]KOR85301.1 serine kinase [Bacillus sp. FJAT-22058]KRF50768.1 serine kinase [Bacillus sp. Soil745]MBD8137164.1 HPr kinase/phosphorylase [Bacillus sp. CFBP 13597]MBL3642418.1 HPr kinase/phosphorylase [Bacillus sp. RHFB]MDP9738483.1 HPr kinase/phosphorylase [Bacillus sp. B2I3]MEC0271782.1 HPr(Ser) kinase/phosphatase [Peribacillus castrilensis]PEF37331.1 HPr kinase/phosphorylase [Bacillu
MAKVRTKDIVEAFGLELISGEEGINRPIVTSDLSRPGLEIAGFFDYYPADRVQLLGMTEMSFFNRLNEPDRIQRMEELCRDFTPGIIITRGQEVPIELIEASERESVPVMRSNMKTTRLYSRLTNFLESRLAPTTAVHGVLVDIYGLGVLITGKSGVGKSETALELVKRGHRLVADDCVEIRQEDQDTLVGNAPDLIEHLLEIRGLGIINVMTLFGAGAVRSNKKISIVINLELWEKNKQYDRVGLDEEKMKIIDTEVTKITVPVRPGRNLAVIIEVAAMNYRLKRMGVNAAEQFSDRLNHAIADPEHDEF